MTTLEYRSGAQMKLYGSVHVRVDTGKHTHISLKDCQIVRIWPPGKYTVEQLKHQRIAALYPDDQPGQVLFHTPEVPVGEEVPMDMITIPTDAKVDVEMPVDPD